MVDVKAAVQQQFGQVAANYATSAVHVDGPDLNAMLATRPLAGTRVLDAGCGTGHTALAFAPQVAEVVAVDLTEPMLAQGRRLAAERSIQNVEFRRGDVEQLDFVADTFDIVTSRYSAHHYPHPHQALAEIARVLKPGGTFLLVDVVAPEEALPDTFLNVIELLRDPSHVRDHSISQWKQMLSGAGFSVDVLGQWPLRLEFTSWVTRMRTSTSAIDQIKALFDGAPREVREALAVEPDYSFSVPTALICGQYSSV